jgi:hypothetical protein
MEVMMFAILRGANGRRHDVDFHDDPVTVDVSMSATTVQITMTAAGVSDLSKSRYVTVALPRDALAAAMAAAAARPGLNTELGLRLVDDGYFREQGDEPSNG